MAIQLGVVMDPIQDIYTPVDGSLGLMVEAQKKGWELYYMEPSDLFCRDGVVWARMCRVSVSYDSQHWYDILSEDVRPLHSLDTVIMRKDPPFDMEYIYSTYLLELAEEKGCLVVNKPRSIRDANEKMFISRFPSCCTPTLVSKDFDRINQFVDEQGDVILKPLDYMGGRNVFHLKAGEHNVHTAIETLTQRSQRTIMAQRYIPDIMTGDKRIFICDGEVIPYAYLRFPEEKDFRTGPKGKAIPLTDRDRWIAAQVGPVLREKGLIIVGIDVIGDYLTEINVTSPTLFRQLEASCGMKVTEKFIQAIEKRLAEKNITETVAA